MNEKHATMVTRAAYGKVIGFLFGLLDLVIVTYTLPEIGWSIRFGVLFFGLKLGLLVSPFSVDIWHPILPIEFIWWVMGPLIGTWFCLVLILFIGQPYEKILLQSDSFLSSFASPLWLILDGAIVGLIIAVITHSKVED